VTVTVTVTVIVTVTVTVIVTKGYLFFYSMLGHSESSCLIYACMHV
jgi:hypothetical protein